MAQMTTEEFMDSANQAQVAKVVTQAVGPNVPVMTGVRTASGDCLTVEAVGDDTVWTQSDCEEAAPALCVAESPAVRACSLLPPTPHPSAIQSRGWSAAERIAAGGVAMGTGKSCSLRCTLLLSLRRKTRTSSWRRCRRRLVRCR